MKTWTMPIATATAKMVNAKLKKDECLYATGAKGISALYLASALRKVKLKTIDTNETPVRTESETISVNERNVTFTLTEFESSNYSLVARFI